ncbi:hypothetical protein M413DRAFT_32303 [Hebeloma cylindrosporum]|uniref:Uncharacterized protein n=1 Tax=Hebeloma cylindrosporum TaxID=76867 RepID=A0A0C3BUK5_HEBCY|nr:hypothetical protein M413DRAFT_32303 [Hebeloma cylindrosporum h7]
MSSIFEYFVSSSSIQSPEFQALLDRNSRISLSGVETPPPEATTIVIVRKANGPLRIEKRTLRSNGHHVANKFYSRDDVLQAARHVVVDESPDLDFDHLAVTALKWTRGILNYHSARALLDCWTWVMLLQTHTLHPSSRNLTPHLVLV